MVSPDLSEPESSAGRRTVPFSPSIRILPLWPSVAPTPIQLAANLLSHDHRLFRAAHKVGKRDDGPAPDGPGMFQRLFVGVLEVGLLHHDAPLANSNSHLVKRLGCFPVGHLGS